MTDIEETPLVSVVVTTRNEEKNIGRCLESVKAQSWPNIEMIVVDNFSTDATRDIASNYTSKVFCLGPERSAQRNYGMIEAAEGKYVAYIDADMILSPLVIESGVGLMASGRWVALHVPEVVLGVNFWSRVRRFERGFYDGTAIDGARFFDRAVFMEVGGFDEDLFREGSGEDWDIDKLVKKKGEVGMMCSIADKPQQWPPTLLDFIVERGVHPDPRLPAIYHNESDFQLVPYLKKKSYYAKGFDGYINKWGRDDPDIRKQFGLWYRFFGVFLEDGKWTRLVRHPVLTAGMYTLRFLVGLTYVFRRRSK